MFKKSFLFLLFTSVSIFAQSELPNIGIKKSLALGIVKSIGEKQMVVGTKDGMLNVVLLKATIYKRVSSDNLSLKAAIDSYHVDVVVGDRVLVAGKVSSSKKSILAKTVYLVKNSDVKAHWAKEIQKWRKRGISGRVVAIELENKVITIETWNISGRLARLKLTPKEKVKYLRYDSDSIKYKDAIESEFSAIKVGDMFRALGDRSEDRTSFKAEQILTGAFQTVAGTIKAINVKKKEVTIIDIKTKKDVVIVVNSKSIVKKFPKKIAQAMVRRQMARVERNVQVPQNANSKKTESRGKSNIGKTQNRSNKRRSQMQDRVGEKHHLSANINNMLNLFPNIKITSLKVGDMIAASSQKRDNSTRLIAIKLLAGVEPFLKEFYSPRGASVGRIQSGVRSGFTIPGLDSIDF